MNCFFEHHLLSADQYDPEVKLGHLRRFSLKELKSATENFSAKNILGKGGFGIVYRGKLPDGTIVAVKRLKDCNAGGGEVQFQTEVEMISLAIHRNLLRLVGFCSTHSERLLVYPYMANGSVASQLRGNCLPVLERERDRDPSLIHLLLFGRGKQAGLGDKEEDSGGDGPRAGLPARAVRPEDHPPGREGGEHPPRHRLRGRRRRLRAGQAARPRRLPRHHRRPRHCRPHRPRVSLHGAVLR